jgi:hypothetical protein
MKNPNQIGVLLLFATLPSCVAVPASSDELAERGSLERDSSAGLAQGRLVLLDEVVAGSSDFALELSPIPPYQRATLDELVAVMPNHGHRAIPAAIEASDTGYHIIDLRLTMSGVWQLRAGLSVDDRRDELAFEIDVP